MAGSWPAVWGRSVLRVVAAAGIAVSIGGCAGMANGLQQQWSPEQTSLYGNYLAARHAGKHLDASAAARYYSRALATRPDDQSLLERAFLLELNSGDVADAVTLGRRIIEIRPDDRLARLVLAVEAMRVGAYARAREHVQAAGPGPLTDLVNRLIIAWSYAGEGDTSRGLSMLAGLSAVEGLDLYRTFHSALMLDLAGRMTDAESNYDEAMQLSNRTSIRVVEAYGRFLEHDRRYKQAAAVYETFLLEVGNHPLIAASLYRAQREERNVARLVPSARAGAAESIYALAGALAREDERGPDLPLVYMRLALHLRSDFDIAQSLLADLLEQGNRTQDAVAAYRGVSRESPLWANARIRIAHNLNRLEKRDEAIRVLQDVIDVAPENIDVLVSIAEMLHANEHYGASADYYARAIDQIDEIEPRHWALFYQYGIVLERSKRWDEAEVYLRRALELQPEQPYVLNYLGYSWIDQGVNLDEAMQMIRSAAAQEPENGYIIDSLGWGYYRLGDYESAVTHLERAVLLEPGDPIINDHLGDAYWQVGRELEARFQWSHALALDPEPDLEAKVERKLIVGLSEPALTATPAATIADDRTAAPGADQDVPTGD